MSKISPLLSEFSVRLKKEIFLSCSLLMSENYGMVPCTTFVWFFCFGSTSYVIPVVRYNAKKVSHSNMHVESKNQNTKRRVETKSIPYFCFWIKWYWRANFMKKTSSMSKDSSNLSKSRFGCNFRCSLVNFKILIINFGTYGLRLIREKVKVVLCLIQNT